MNIKTANFIISNTDVAKCPKEPLPEYAFIGRSNVGKSSLINSLTERKSLAKTSGRPGKTQLINHFKINENWFLVDLPGYGYARVSKKSKSTFQKYITDYFVKREQLVCAFVLVDIRHEPQKIDLEFMEWLGENNIPFCIIFTKADKLKPKGIEKNVNNYITELLNGVWEEAPQYFITSSSKGYGRDDVLDFIDNINTDFFKATQN
ncbi:ribosome biogenesis GTP-binding protein YihA/YsxC [Zobellia uliginosa]|uniref:ribosome biogenesis GTP-binding protein YihA/YsxC n=1 Tax=Zobellia uliginosa TaxID=143224 RepID=UPI001C070188|nr:ribosome biogenesis GTP-binding protein YihA/YsxC [Zobellia uliginosa]